MHIKTSMHLAIDNLILFLNKYSYLCLSVCECNVVVVYLFICKKISKSNNQFYYFFHCIWRMFWNVTIYLSSGRIHLICIYVCWIFVLIFGSVVQTKKNRVLSFKIIFLFLFIYFHSFLNDLWQVQRLVQLVLPRYKKIKKK